MAGTWAEPAVKFEYRRKKIYQRKRRKASSVHSSTKDFQHDSAEPMGTLFRADHITELRKIVKMRSQTESGADRQQEVFPLSTTRPSEQRLYQEKDLHPRKLQLISSPDDARSTKNGLVAFTPTGEIDDARIYNACI
jgi:hypothetical protein